MHPIPRPRPRHAVGTGQPPEGDHAIASSRRSFLVARSFQYLPLSFPGMSYSTPLVFLSYSRSRPRPRARGAARGVPARHTGHGARPRAIGYALQLTFLHQLLCGAGYGGRHASLAEQIWLPLPASCEVNSTWVLLALCLSALEHSYERSRRAAQQQQKRSSLARTSPCCFGERAVVLQELVVPAHHRVVCHPRWSRRPERPATAVCRRSVSSHGGSARPLSVRGARPTARLLLPAWRAGLGPGAAWPA